MIPIMIEEVYLELQDTLEGKAPWLIEFTVYFLHHCSPIIREDVWEIIEDSRDSVQVLLALNSTLLTLIPKED